jgi:HlyD family secretion protein
MSAGRRRTIAERAVTGARIELDYALSRAVRSNRPNGRRPPPSQRSQERLERECVAFVKAQSKSNLPAQQC